MPVSGPPANVVRFDSFEVDLDSGELRHAGVRVPLGEQPTQVLLKLVEAQGGLVTRDAMRAALWPPTTFVEDADQGLNAAVKRLRDALHDTADEPRYVETVPRRGYRFIGVLEGELAGSHAPTTPGPDTGQRTSRRVVLALAVAAALVGTWTLWPTAAPRITSVRPIVQGLERVGLLPPTYWSWATDGERVYMAMPRRAHVEGAPQYALYSAPLVGGEPTEISLPPQGEVRVLGYVGSEAGLLLAASSETNGTASLWLVPAAGGAPRRVPNLQGLWAALAPDGRTLAIIQAGRGAARRLVLARMDGSEIRDRGPLPPWTWRGHWAPDGRRLRVSDGGDRIWEVGVEDASVRPLWNGARGNWTPDGRFFVFDRGEPSAFRRDLAAHREASWYPPRMPSTYALTVGPMSFWSPGSSRDGRRLLAFGTDARAELMRFDPGTRTFLPALGGLPAIYARPSPDGAWLAWIRYPEGTLWRSRPDGSDAQQLTSPPLEAHRPRWSPDGRTLVFAAGTRGQPRGIGIHVIAADGSSTAVIAHSDQDNFWDPCWLPDGNIAFSRRGGLTQGGILTVNPRTKQVTSMPGTDELHWPKCSPLGDLAAVDYGASGQTLQVLRRRNSTWENFGPNVLGYPEWTRDGQWFCGVPYWSQRVDCVSVSTREVVTRAEAPFPLLEWHGSAWGGLDADDQPLVTADRSTAGFYALDWDAP